MAVAWRPLGGRGQVRRIGALSVAAALAGATLAVVSPGPQPANAAELVNYIEVNGTCSLAEAIAVANGGAVWSPNNPESGGETADCFGFVVPTTTIRITANSGTAENPTAPSATSPGVQLDPAVPHAGALVGGGRSILPTITGAGIVIEGDPTQPQPANGYSIYVSEPAGREPAGRILDVAQGASLTLRNLNLGGGAVASENPTADGAPLQLEAGGAVYARGALTLDNVTFLGNRVTGNPSFGIGGDASGGAVYAETTLTVTNSVFERNSVQGGQRGGDALGGAIGLAPAATATVSDTIFQSNQAYGGTGDAGSDGRDGSDGIDGRDGVCNSSWTSLARGEDGGAARDGGDGRDGDHGGDAVGAVAGGRSITIDHSSFIDSVAVAGAAGVGGFGGKGGQGGAGGNGKSCGAGFGGFPWHGNGGDGGHGGDDGWNGVPGARGTAAATVSAATTQDDADVDLTLVDVTISGGSATVPADNFGTRTRDDWLVLHEAALADITGGSGGAEGFPQDGVGLPGKVGAGGIADTHLAGREFLVPLGEAEVFGQTGLTVNTSFTTVADIEPEAPKTEAYRNDQTAPVGLSLAGGRIKGSLVWQVGGCPNLISDGWNVFAATDCPGTARATDRDHAPVSARPMDANTGTGTAVIRPANRPGNAYRMPVLPIATNSPARNFVPQGSPGVTRPCQVIGQTGVKLADDGRRSPRSDVLCDAGAFESDGIVPSVALSGPPALYRDSAPGQVELQVPTYPGLDATLIVSVQGIDGVEFPPLTLAAGGTVPFQPTDNDADANFSEASIALTSDLEYGFIRTLSLTAPGAAIDSVKVTATIVKSGGGANSTLTIPVRHDGQLDVVVTAPAQWSPCSGYLPLTYTADSIGHSPAPAATILVLPNIAQPNVNNGLITPPGRAPSTPPLVYPSAGSSAAINQVTGQIAWFTPAVLAGAAPPTLTVYVPIGEYPQTLIAYTPGMRVLVTSQIFYAPEAANDTFTPLPRDAKYVTITNDLDLLSGQITGTDGADDPGVLTKGEPGTLFGKINPGACAAPSTQPHDWGTVNVTVRDPETGTIIVDHLDTDNLQADGSRWFPLTFTPPTSIGTHKLEFTFSAPNSDPVTTFAPYVVKPLGLNVVDGAPALEATGTSTVKVQLDHAVDQDITVHWSTEPGTATAESDYLPQQGDVTILKGATSKTIPVTTVDDSVPEPDEQLTVRITETPGAPLPGDVAIERNVASGTILNDDFGLSIADVSAIEAGNQVLDFDLTSPLPNPSTCSLTAATVLDGTASASDVVLPGDNGVKEFTIPAGTTAIEIPYPVGLRGDAIAEADETLHVVLGPGTSGADCGLARDTALGTIIDNDPATLSINKVSVPEGAGPASFRISSSHVADHDVTVHATTFAGTAGTGDFTATDTLVTIPAGQDHATLNVPIVADAIDESTEKFTVELSDSTGGPIDPLRHTGTATILDDDTAAISIGDTTVAEGAGTAAFPITLATVADHAITVDAATREATAGTGDFTDTETVVTIPAGSTSATFTVPVTADAVDEPDETFTVVLSAPVGAPISVGTATGTILDDDGPTTLTPSAAKTIVAGSTVTLTATLRADGVAVPGKSVALQRSANNATWSAVGTYLTNTSGMATSASQKPATTTYYRWVFAGTDGYLASTSTSTKVTVLAKTTLTPSRSVRIAYGRSTTLHARLTAGSTAIGGASLRLQQLRAGTTTWARVATVTTGSTGYAGYTVKPARNTKYRWVFAATSVYASATSATTTVLVSQVVTIHATATRLARGSKAAVTLYGSVTPSRTGQRVVVQVDKGGKWVNTTWAATTKRQMLPNGVTKTAYVITVPERTAGMIRYRTYVAATSLNAAGYSTSITITVT